MAMQIKQLQIIIEIQKQKIKELKQQNKLLEDDLINSLKLKSQSIKERDEALTEKKNHESFFIKDFASLISCSAFKVDFIAINVPPIFKNGMVYGSIVLSSATALDVA